MDNNIQRFLEGIKVGAKQGHKNMTLYCLLSAQESGSDFISLDEALDSRALTITELDESGRVPELKVTNKSDNKILILDGEELVGAKQNRVLNVTVLIAAQSETIIPVSCVEQGRWSYKSREFKSARRTMSPDLKKKKARSVTQNLMRSGSFASAQSMVWDEIEAKFDRMASKPSPTSALSDLYESHEDSAKDYLKAFQPVDNQVGIAVFIDGLLAGVEILDNFKMFRSNHSKLVQSYVMDALETIDVQTGSNPKPSKAKTSKILQAASTAKVEKRKSVALGDDVRLESEDVIGAGLEFEDQLVQLTLFMQDEEETSDGSKSTMSRASRRRSSIIIRD